MSEEAVLALAGREPLLVGWAVWLCPVCQELVSRGEGAREGDAHCAGSLTERTAHENTPMRMLTVVQISTAEALRDALRSARDRIKELELELYEASTGAD